MSVFSALEKIRFLSSPLIISKKLFYMLILNLMMTYVLGSAYAEGIPDNRWPQVLIEGGEPHFESVTGIVSGVTDESFLIVDLNYFLEDEEIQYEVEGLYTIIIKLRGVEIDMNTLSFITLQRRVSCLIFSNKEQYDSNGFSEGSCSIVFSDNVEDMHISPWLRYLEIIE